MVNRRQLGASHPISGVRVGVGPGGNERIRPPHRICAHVHVSGGAPGGVPGWGGGERRAAPGPREPHDVAGPCGENPKP